MDLICKIKKFGNRLKRYNNASYIVSGLVTLRVASTKFSIKELDNHRMVLKGTFLFDHQIQRVLSELDIGVTNKYWQFSRSDGSIISPAIRLLADT
jgi:hypothetical protein